MSKRINVGFLVTHPIQYQVPMFRALAAHPGINLKVYFQSDCSVRGYYDKGFGQHTTWDVPLLEGYESEFLPTIAGDIHTFTRWRPWSRGLLARLRRDKIDVLWVFGYARPFNMITIFGALMMGVRVILRDEPNSITTRRDGLKELVKSVYIRLFSAVGGQFMAIGSINAEYFRRLGMDKGKIVVGPYSVDNEFFKQRAEEAKPHRAKLKAELGLEPGIPIILYASKFLKRKRADDLLNAYLKLAQARIARNETVPYLVYVGTGEIMERVQALAAAAPPDRVKFLGFKNQSELPAYYDLCDVFVLPSDNENWGLVVNEAMNAGKAIVVTDGVASGYDLVREDVNGSVVPVGDIDRLASSLDKCTANAATIARMGAASQDIIANWGIPQIVSALEKMLGIVGPESAPAKAEAPARLGPTTASRPVRAPSP